jgi:tRNA G18 (ribose-2'-O)-methylase SpoU
MARIVVDDPTDPRLADYVQLTDVKLRTSMEAAHGLALGTDAVILSPRCADPLYRRAIKVSMGAVFAIPYARMTNWRAGLAEIRAAGFTVLALTPDQSAVALDDVPMPARVALLLGTEGDGLSSRWLDQADHPVCIPMSAGAMTLGVDSLNVVAAAAIACHGLARGSTSGAAARRARTS